MPWKAVGKNIIRADTGKVVGHSSSNMMAKRAVRARYANASRGESFAKHGVAMSAKAKHNH